MADFIFNILSNAVLSIIISEKNLSKIATEKIRSNPIKFDSESIYIPNYTYII